MDVCVQMQSSDMNSQKVSDFSWKTKQAAKKVAIKIL